MSALQIELQWSCCRFLLVIQDKSAVKMRNSKGCFGSDVVARSIRSHMTQLELFRMQTLTSQPRSSGWLSQPWGNWQWQQLATAADSWIFIDSRTQTRAECNHPLDASMHF